MIKLLVKLILLVSAFFITDFLTGKGLKYITVNSPDGRYFKAGYSLNNCNADIVIFGASGAENDYVPFIIEDSLKMTCWNTGRGGQGFPFMICMEQGILKRYVPRIAILDMDAEYLSRTSPDSYDRVGFLRPFYHDHTEIQPVLNRISPFEKYYINSSLYAYNSSYYYLLRPYFFKGIDGKNGDKGWKPRYGKMLKPSTEPVTINTNKKLNTETVALFNEFVSDLADKGCKVFVVMSPLYNQNVKNTSTIEYIRGMKKASLIRIENTECITENSDFFRDEGHLNVEGATLFTSLLTEKIRKIYCNKSTQVFER